MAQIVNPQPKSKDVDVSTKQSILAALAANKVSVDDALEALKAVEGGSTKLAYKVSEKGALSVYGLQRLPITLYVDQWEKLIANADRILAFAKEHASELSRRYPVVNALHQASGPIGDRTIATDGQAAMVAEGSEHIERDAPAEPCITNVNAETRCDVVRSDPGGDVLLDVDTAVHSPRGEVVTLPAEDRLNPQLARSIPSMNESNGVTVDVDLALLKEACKAIVWIINNEDGNGRGFKLTVSKDDNRSASILARIAGSGGMLVAAMP